MIETTSRKYGNSKRAARGIEEMTRLGWRVASEQRGTMAQRVVVFERGGEPEPTSDLAGRLAALEGRVAVLEGRM
jgi:hypothetical protein